jgi:hypothetical protein
MGEVAHTFPDELDQVEAAMLLDELDEEKKSRLNPWLTALVLGGLGAVTGGLAGSIQGTNVQMTANLLPFKDKLNPSVTGALALGVPMAALGAVFAKDDHPDYDAQVNQEFGMPRKELEAAMEKKFGPNWRHPGDGPGSQLIGVHKQDPSGEWTYTKH